MRPSSFVLISICAPLLHGPAAGATASQEAGEPPPRDVTALLAPIVERHGVPGMSAAVVTSAGLEALGWTGLRSRGAPAPIERSDLFSLGSDTKAMTATLLGVLDEAGELGFDTTLAEAFPALGETMDAGWRAVTLEQLLWHRGGAPGARPALWKELLPGRDDPLGQRRTVVETLLTSPPPIEPGARYEYSNFGYALVGAAMEVRLEQPWETLMRERLFAPLEMASAGFGAPGTPDTIDQPRGHNHGGVKGIPPGPFADNPPGIGPAATVHASIEDWARFLSLHLDAARGAARLLEPETFARLHRPPVDDEHAYAGGWIVLDADWARGRVLTHAGSNTMWWAEAWIAPELDLAVAVVCNQGDRAGTQAVQAAVRALFDDALSNRPAK